MGGELELIWADRDDLPEVARLLEWRRTGAAEAPALTWSQLSPRYGAGLAALAGGGLQVLLARIGSAPVGYLTAAVIPKLDQRLGVLYVDELWVAPPHRSAGIARAMLSAAAARVGSSDSGACACTARQGSKRRLGSTVATSPSRGATPCCFSSA